MSSDEARVPCSSCGRVRTARDHDYSLLDAVRGLPCGWYSGDDGDICGACMDAILTPAADDIEEGNRGDS